MMEERAKVGSLALLHNMKKLAVAALALLLISCSPSEKDSSIDIALMQEPPTLDVQVNSSISGKMIAVGNIFEKLVNLDEDGDIACSLASSYSLSEDGRSLEFTLRDDVVFHDGSALDAEDAAASLNRWLRVYPAARDAAGSGTFSADGSKVRIESDSSLLMLLMMMASSPQCAAIMPSETLSEDNDYSLSEYIGTGPYRISEWYPGDYIELERFGDYHERDASGSAVLRYIFVPDGTTRRLGLESGLYDAIDCVLSDDIPRLMENEGIKLIEGDESGSIALVLNKREGIFSDLDNRRSLSLMIDRNELMAACYGDYGYSVDSSYMENGLWHVDPSLDPYGRKEEGIALPEGERIRILSSNTSNLDKIAIALSSELEKAGVESEVIVLDWASFIERRKDPSSWDIFISAYSRTALPQLKSYLSESNPGWLDDDQALALLEALNDVRSVEDAVRQWNDAQLYLWEIVPAIVPGHYTTVYGIRSDLEGVELAEGFYFQSASLS